MSEEKAHADQAHADQTAPKEQTDSEGRWKVHRVRCSFAHYDKELTEALNKFEAEGVEVHSVTYLESISGNRAEFVVVARKRAPSFMVLFKEALSKELNKTVEGATRAVDEEEEDAQDESLLPGMKAASHYFDCSELSRTALYVLQTTYNMMGTTDKTQHDKYARQIVEKYLEHLNIDERAKLVTGLIRVQADMPGHAAVCSDSGCLLEGAIDLVVPHAEQYHQERVQ